MCVELFNTTTETSQDMYLICFMKNMFTLNQLYLLNTFNKERDVCIAHSHHDNKEAANARFILYFITHGVSPATTKQEEKK